MTPVNICKAISCPHEIDPQYDFCQEHKGLAAFGRPVAPNPVANTVHSRDPFGKDQHSPGAKVDADKPRMHLITGGMARALIEVAKVGTFGAAKYTDDGWVEVPDGFRRYEDAQQRHAAYRHMGEDHDPESGLLHLAHEAWNALAKLDLHLRNYP